MTPRFSIITRTASRLCFLHRVREGLAVAAPADSEWIICDDAPNGTNDLETFVDNARSTLPFAVSLVPVHSANRSRAANAGLAKATGTYVHIHDDDDTVSPAFYRRTAEFLDAHPHFGGVSVFCNRVDETLSDDGFVVGRQRPHYHEVRAISLLSMATTQTIAPIGFLARRTAVERTGPFDETLAVCEDHEFFLRFLLIADIGVLSEQLAAFHHRPLNAMGDSANSLASTDHETQDALFRNEMLRRDHASGLVGLGWLLSMGEANRPAWRRRVALRRLGRYLPAAIARRL